MSAIKLSSRYARSLITLAEEQNVLDEVYADIKMLQGVFKSNRDLVAIMRSPVITSDKKLNIFKQAFAPSINELTYKFIQILIKKGRERFFPEIIHSYLHKHNELKNISPVRLITAVELDAEQKEKIKKSVKGDLSVGDIELESLVDPELIGGYVVQYQDKLIDSSISSRLKTLRKNIDDSSYKVKF